MAAASAKVKARPPKSRVAEPPAKRPDAIEELDAFFKESLASTPAERRDDVTVTAAKKPTAAVKPAAIAKPKVKAKAPPARTKPAPPDAEEETAEEEAPAPKKGAKKAAAKNGKEVNYAELSRARSKLLTSLVMDAQATYANKSITVAGDVGRLVAGIRMPFPMEYVLQNDVLPLSRMIQLVGVAKANKSALAFEFVRWFAVAMGMGYLFENEDKYSPDLAQSIFGYPFDGGAVLGHFPCTSTEDWQAKVRHVLKGIKERMIKGVFEVVKSKKTGKKQKQQVLPPTGRTLPVLLLLDSIACSLTEEKQKEIDKKGFASRNYATEAMLNQDFLKSFRSELIGWPIAFVFVNHLKKQKAENGGYLERKKQGGKHLEFCETFEIEMTKIGTKKWIDDRPDAPSLDVEANVIKIECQKNSLGVEDREIKIQFRWQNDWYTDPRTGEREVIQRSKWMWGEALVDLLGGLEGSRKDRARDVVDITAGKEGAFRSKRLGIGKGHEVSKEQLGQAIMDDPKILHELRDLFAIKRRSVFQPGMEYKKLLEREQRTMEQRMNQ